MARSKQRFNRRRQARCSSQQQGADTSCTLPFVTMQSWLWQVSTYPGQLDVCRALWVKRPSGLSQICVCILPRKTSCFSWPASQWGSQESLPTLLPSGSGTATALQEESLVARVQTLRSWCRHGSWCAGAHNGTDTCCIVHERNVAGLSHSTNGVSVRPHCCTMCIRTLPMQRHACQDLAEELFESCMQQPGCQSAVFMPSRRQQQRHACAAASSRDDTGSASGSISGRSSVKQRIRQEQQQRERPDPWYIGFQTNERTLEWEESATLQLCKQYVAQKSGQVFTARQKPYQFLDRPWIRDCP